MVGREQTKRQKHLRRKETRKNKGKKKYQNPLFAPYRNKKGNPQRTNKKVGEKNSSA